MKSHANPTRRSIIKSALVTVAAPALGTVGIAPLYEVARAQPAAAQAPDATSAAWRHGLSLFGELKYPAGFKQFEYVNSNAPHGGLVRLSREGSFDTLNFAITKGTVAAGITLIYDTLMASALDEIASEYGLLAEAVRHPDDWSSVTYRLRREAKWHDGAPVTPEDVVWTFGVLKQHNPQQAFYYRHVVKAEVTGEREVTFTFDKPGNRELPQIVGQLNVLPKHWWTGKDASGKARDITGTSLEIPLGSSAYQVKSVVPGRSISYARRGGLLGPQFAGEYRLEQFRRNPLRILPRRHGRA